MFFEYGAQYGCKARSALVIAAFELQNVIGNAVIPVDVGFAVNA